MLVEPKNGDHPSAVDRSDSQEGGRIHLQVEKPKTRQILFRLKTDSHSLHEDISQQISTADPVLSEFIEATAKLYDDPFSFSLGVGVAWSVCHGSTIPLRPPISYSSWKQLGERIPTDEATRQFYQENFDSKQEAEIFLFFRDATTTLGIDIEQGTPQTKAFINGYFKYLGLLILELNPKEVK